MKLSGHIYTRFQIPGIRCGYIPVYDTTTGGVVIAYYQYHLGIMHTAPRRVHGPNLGQAQAYQGWVC